MRGTHIFLAMNYSAYNIYSQLRDSKNFYLINILSGNADILSPEEAARFREGSFSDEEKETYRSKGYLADPEDEKRRYRKAYLDFIDQRESGEIQIFFVPTYACNFNCAYCYQEGYSGEPDTDQGEVVEAFYRYIDEEFAGRRKYITIFGGEPLLSGSLYRSRIEMLLEGASRRNLDVAVVTNGYNLKEYIPLFSNHSIREIQVTLDGTEEVHDRRRPLKDGSGTFQVIAAGIDGALKAGFPVNLRVVVDKENMENLPNLAAFAGEKGWTENPLFKTQLGRNYELHYCQKDESSLYSRLEMYQELYSLIQTHPGILDFHKPAYSISRFLFENGNLPEPLFDSCPGCKTEWAFDYRGTMYSCTATVGKPGEELGTFFPEVTRKQELIDEWEERDVTTIEKCRTCELQLACGGGCASVAKNNTGNIHAPDCRPVRELLELGISLYYNQIEQGA